MLAEMPHVREIPCVQVLQSSLVESGRADAAKVSEPGEGALANGGRRMSGILTRRIAGALAVLGVAATSPLTGQDPDITITFSTGAEPNGDAWHLVEAAVWTFDIIAPKTLVVLASARTRTVADRAAGRTGSMVEGIYENREPIQAGSVAKVYWAGALRGLDVFVGEEWPEPRSFERLESVKVRVWGDDSVYTMPCKENTSRREARVFECWLDPGQPSSR